MTDKEEIAKLRAENEKMRTTLSLLGNIKSDQIQKGATVHTMLSLMDLISAAALRILSREGVEMIDKTTNEYTGTGKI